MPLNKLKIGITMRITETSGYSERRDSIAQDWQVYLQKIIPDFDWMYIPNIGKKAVNYIDRWNLNGFILTGGDDIGVFPQRDLTEYTILDYSLINGYPTVGVCRGLQLIYSFFGGRIIKGDSNFTSLHKSVEHHVTFGNQITIVNSYHTNLLDESSLPHELKIMARCTADDTIEAVSYRNLLGIMWHPERDNPFQDWNADLIKNLFYKDSDV